MRLLSIIAAIAVTLVIYAFVFERAWLIEHLTSSDATAQTAVAAKATDPSTATPARAAVRVAAIHSRAQTIDSTIVLRGQTEAAREVEVRGETSGKVLSEPLRKGAFVEAGQLLCELAPGTRQAALAEARAGRAEAEARIPEAQARLTEAEARVAEAELSNTAAATLSASGYASETRVAEARAVLSAAHAAVQAAKSGLDAARTGIEAADANIAAAKEELARLKITAPFAGLLESDTAELGSLLQPGALCAVVIQLDPIKLVGHVPETDVARITLGAQAHAKLISGQEIAGKVTFLSRSADPETRTFRVEVIAPNTALSLRDGQSVEIMVASEGTAAHLLPQSALTLNDAGTLGVRVVIDGSAEFRPVTLMRDTVEGVWVTGLPAAADVIVIGQEYVISGVPVIASYPDADTKAVP